MTRWWPTVVDFYDFARDEQAWAREGQATSTDPQVRVLLGGYRAKLFELEAGLLEFARTQDPSFPERIGELLAQRSNFPD